VAPLELPLVLGLIAVVIAAQLALSRSFDLFTRHLWFDEIVTHVLTTDRSLGRSMRALASGLDTNPPTYHLLLRVFFTVVRGNDDAILRLFSLLWMSAALAGIYANLRLVVAPVVAIAVLLAIWQHPLVLRFAFEGRMYSAWLAATVWFSYALTQTWTSPLELQFQVLLAVTSLLACTTHTLGPLSVALVVGAQLLTHATAPSTTALVLAGLGPIAFLAWAPFLTTQNAAHVGTWISRPSARMVVYLARPFAFPNHVGAMLLLAGGASPFVQAIWPGHAVGVAAAANWLDLSGLAALLLMPVALLLLSCVTQPLCHERYAFPAIAAYAPALAFVIAPLPPVGVVMLCGLLFLSGANELAHLASGFRTLDRNTGTQIDALRELGRAQPVLFESLLHFGVVCRYAPDVRDRCFMLDFEAGELGTMDSARLFARDFARMLQRFYPEWATMRWQIVKNLRRFLFVAAPPADALLTDLQDADRRQVVRLIAPTVYQVEALPPVHERTLELTGANREMP
jgi:hypothetical protein